MDCCAHILKTFFCCANRVREKDDHHYNLRSGAGVVEGIVWDQVTFEPHLQRQGWEPWQLSRNTYDRKVLELMQRPDVGRCVAYSISRVVVAVGIIPFCLMILFVSASTCVRVRVPANSMAPSWS